MYTRTLTDLGLNTAGGDSVNKLAPYLDRFMGSLNKLINKLKTPATAPSVGPKPNVSAESDGLSASTRASFQDGKYSTWVADKDIILYRAENKSEGMGRYIGLEKPAKFS